MASRLKENFQYVRIANLAAAERTLQLVASQYLTLIAGEIKSETTFTGIPGELVRNMLKDLVYFFFSYVSSNLRGSPSPSLPNLSTTAFFGATLRFATCVVSQGGL